MGVHPLKRPLQLSPLNWLLLDLVDQSVRVEVFLRPAHYYEEATNRKHCGATTHVIRETIDFVVAQGLAHIRADPKRSAVDQSWIELTELGGGYALGTMQMLPNDIICVTTPAPSDSTQNTISVYALDAQRCRECANVFDSSDLAETPAYSKVDTRLRYWLPSISVNCVSLTFRESWDSYSARNVNVAHRFWELVNIG
jgi:hypothetical protein